MQQLRWKEQGTLHLKMRNFKVFPLKNVLQIPEDEVVLRQRLRLL